tara:strand:- start:5 stop:289 length:285 start_codon:yes stop_codon:yes gene_type:complete
MTRETQERTRRHRSGKRLSAEDRAEYARQRRALVGTLITQEGFEAALVVEHIRGSQYLIRMPDGAEVFASHKKQRDNNIDNLSDAGWTFWEERR